MNLRLILILAATVFFSNIKVYAFPLELNIEKLEASLLDINELYYSNNFDEEKKLFVSKASRRFKIEGGGIGNIKVISEAASTTDKISDLYITIEVETDFDPYIEYKKYFEKQAVISILEQTVLMPDSLLLTEFARSGRVFTQPVEISGDGREKQSIFYLTPDSGFILSALAYNPDLPAAPRKWEFKLEFSDKETLKNIVNNLKN